MLKLKRALWNIFGKVCLRFIIGIAFLAIAGCGLGGKFSLSLQLKDLADRLEVMCREDEGLLANIREQFSGGANYMFVAPFEGKAIKSFDLSEFVSRFN